MPAKKATKTANCNVYDYDGDFQVLFECVGVESCRHALCSTMPPDGQDQCFYFETGNCCNNLEAKIAALRSIKNKITNRLKKFTDEIEYGC